MWNLAGSRKICATLRAGSGQGYSPGISCRQVQLLGCYPQLWKLFSIFSLSDTFPTTLFKAFNSSKPWISVFCKFYFIVFHLWPCSHHKAKDLCTGLGAALCPALSKGTTGVTRRNLEMRKNKELPRWPKKMLLAQEAKSPCKPRSWVYSDGRYRWRNININK